MIIRSDRDDLFAHLAAEDLLLEEPEAREPCLLLWRNGPAVVIGKNQLPWRECRPAGLAREGVCLARRLSGGGAVYHDPGNLNVSFLLPRDRYRPAELYGLILSALRACGLRAALQASNTLALGGRKISGHAFGLRRNKALHHGTLLVHADLDRLRGSLKPCDGTFSSRAVPSVPASVTNVAEVRPDLTIDAVGDRIAAAFLKRFGGDPEPVGLERLDLERLRRRARELAAPEWVLGRSPDAAIRLYPGTQQPGAAGRPLELTVQRGRILRIEGAPDAAALDPVLQGCLLDSGTVREALLGSGQPPDFAETLLAAGY